MNESTSNRSAPESASTLCQYCQKPTKRQFQDPKHYYSGGSRIHDDNCETWVCRAKYKVWETGQIIDVGWPTIEIKGIHYRINLCEEKFHLFAVETHFTIRHRVREEDAIIALKMGSEYKWEELIKWDFVPSDWSPQNQKEKLAKLLPFL